MLTTEAPVGRRAVLLRLYCPGWRSGAGGRMGLGLGHWHLARAAFRGARFKKAATLLITII
ncbi:MAG TPA: hypothetical protein PKV33_05580 [Methanothrix sp.]|nr:hypothetical protein [Methanothrix sp.]